MSAGSIQLACIEVAVGCAEADISEIQHAPASQQPGTANSSCLEQLLALAAAPCCLRLCTHHDGLLITKGLLMRDGVEASSGCTVTWGSKNHVICAFAWTHLGRNA